MHTIIREEHSKRRRGGGRDRVMWLDTAPENTVVDICKNTRKLHQFAAAACIFIHGHVHHVPQYFSCISLVLSLYTAACPTSWKKGNIKLVKKCPMTST